MTTPTTPAERPEMMTAEEFASFRWMCETFGEPLSRIYAEAQRARAHEEDGWALAESQAHEAGLHLEARLKAEAERDAAREEAERLRKQMATMKPDLGWDDNEYK